MNANSAGKAGKSIKWQNTRRGAIRLQRYAPSNYSLEIFAPLNASWEEISDHQSKAEAMTAWAALLARMMRPVG